LAEYRIELPPKAELEQKPHAVLLEAREWLARSRFCWGTWMTSDDMKASKSLEFPVVALPGVGHMPAKGEDEQEAAQVFYVVATRAAHKLVIGLGGDWGFGRSLSIAPAGALGLSPARGKIRIRSYVNHFA
jgi:hypothetical protein